MIRKISSNEYLKRYTSMKLEEQTKYKEQVSHWLEQPASLLIARMNDQHAAFHNAYQCSATWNDAECEAWESGAVLLTALINISDTWLPDALYIKAAKRTIRKMVTILSDVLHFSDAPGQQTDAKQPEKPEQPTFEGSQGDQKPRKTEPVKSGKTQAPKGNGGTVVRPKHIDQYAHLLPVRTQEKAAQVKQLLRDLDTARENARLLMNDSNASSADVARWSKEATRIDDKVRGIYKEIDEEWDKLVKSGKIVVDELGFVTTAEKPAEEDKPTEEEKPAPKKAAEKKAEAKKPSAKKAEAKKPSAKKTAKKRK